MAVCGIWLIVSLKKKRVHHHNTPLDRVTAALLLPIVPVVVASASGGIVAEVLPNRDHAVTTLVVSYILWGLGESFSFIVMAVYFTRLQIHNLPPKEVIVSVFLPIGPLGQGVFGIQQLGKFALAVLPKTSAFGSVDSDGLHGGEVFYGIGIFAAFIMWGAALGWLSFALIAVLSIKSFPFNMGWWGFTFPLGVFTTCTGLLAKELSSTFLSIVTTVRNCGAPGDLGSLAAHVSHIDSVLVGVTPLARGGCQNDQTR